MTRNPWRALAVSALLCVVGAGIASCGDDASDGSTTAGVSVTGAWARSSPMVAEAGAAYMTIDSEDGDTLVGVSVDPAVAARAEIHETVMAGGDTTMAPGMTAGDATSMPGAMEPEGMTMQPIPQLAIPAGEPVEMKPGGYHVMLLDLAAPLEIGQTITITLEFEAAGPIDVDVEVREDAP